VGQGEKDQIAARTVLPTPPTPAGALIRLAAASLAFFAALGAGLALAGILVERTLPSSTFAPFGGWQLNTLATLFAVVLSAVLLVAAVALGRRYRRLRGRTPHRRAVVLAAFLPGAFLGSFVGNPMSAAVVWASNHTATATHARVEARHLLAEDGKAPPVRDTGRAAAPAALAARMVQRSDLGTGWYSQVRPDPAETTLSPTAAGLGATQAVRTTLNQAHWTGAAWLPQHLVLEGLLRFTSPAGARYYLVNVFTKEAAVPVHMGDVTVYEGGLGNASSWRWANFVVGSDVFTLSINVQSDGTPTPTDFAALVSKAVRRATN
jgi:hypothetical protein